MGLFPFPSYLLGRFSNIGFCQQSLLLQRRQKNPKVEIELEGPLNLCFQSGLDLFIAERVAVIGHPSILAPSVSQVYYHRAMPLRPVHRLNESANLSSAWLRPRRAASVLPGKIISTFTTTFGLKLPDAP